MQGVCKAVLRFGKERAFTIIYVCERIILYVKLYQIVALQIFWRHRPHAHCLWPHCLCSVIFFLILIVHSKRHYNSFIEHLSIKFSITNAMPTDPLKNHALETFIHHLFKCSTQNANIIKQFRLKKKQTSFFRYITELNMEIDIKIDRKGRTNKNHESLHRDLFFSTSQ